MQSLPYLEFVFEVNQFSHMIGVKAVAFYHVVISETDVYAFSIRQITKINQALTSL